MIYRYHLTGMLAKCSDLDKILIECLRYTPTQEEREFVKNVRAHIHDICEAIKEQDY